MGLDGITRNFLGVLATNRRLGALADIIRAYEALAAQHRGEITAEVTSAHPLTDDQAAALKSKLKAGLGRDVAVDLQVDPAIQIGRASCRERVCQYVSISLCAVSLKKKTTRQLVSKRNH